MSTRICQALRCLLFILLTGCSSTYAQLSEGLCRTLPDSLKPKNKTALTLGEKQRILKNTPDFFLATYAGELNAMALSLKTLARNTTDTKDKIETNYILGLYYSFLDDHKKAIMYFKEAIREIRSSKSDAYNHTLAYCYSDLANSFCNVYVNDDSTITYLHNSLQVKGANKDSVLLSHNYNLYSIIYNQLKLYDKAIYYGNLAVKVTPFRSRWNSDYTILFMSIGIIYRHFYIDTKKRIYADSAHLILRQVMAAKKREAAHWYAQCYYNLGATSYEQGDYGPCRRYMDSASLPLYNRSPYLFTPNSYGIYFYQALCFIKLGKYTDGKRILDTLHIAKLPHIKLMYKTLYEYAQQTNDWEKALGYYKQYVKVADSIDLEGQQGRMFEIERKYELTQKQADIIALENRNLLKEKEKRTIIISACGGILLMIIISLLLYINSRKQQADQKKERETLTHSLYRLEEEMNLRQAQTQAENAMAIADQRKRISQNMHDEVGSSLAALQYYVTDLRERTKEEDIKSILSSIEQETSQVYKQARQFTHWLHNSALQSQYNVIDFLHNLSLQFDEKSSFYIYAQADEASIRQYFTPLHHNEMYRVIKESIANSMKYSGASRMDIQLTLTDGLFQFRIADNGKGITKRKGDGMGLNNLLERIQLLQGQLMISSASTGTVLSGTFPASLEKVLQ